MIDMRVVLTRNPYIYIYMILNVDLPLEGERKKGETLFENGRILSH